MIRAWPLTVRGTGATIVAVACFVVGHEAGLIELVYFGMLLVAVLVASLVSLYLSRRTEEVTRVLSPDVAAVGRETHVTVRVGIRTTLPTAPGVWSDALAGGLEGRASGIYPATGAGWSSADRTVELRYRVEGTRRGIQSLGPLWITSSDPFGLTRRRFRVGERTRVVVGPEVVELAALPAVSGEAGGMLQAAHAQLGEGADNLVARPYAPGDSMRRIHWRASAHRDELMVRQEEQEASPEATVVFDRSVVRWGADAVLSPGADPAFETAVSACVSAVLRLVREGYTVEVTDSDGRALSDPIAGGEIGDVEVLATQLATLTARKGDELAHTASLFAGILTGPVVLVAGRLSPADVDALAPLVHHTALPILLTVDPAPVALERLRGSGWHAGDLAPGGDVVRGWDAALAMGAAHVG